MPRLKLKLSERSYDIHIANGALHNAGTLIKEEGIKGHLALISDSNVAPLYAESLTNSLKSAGYTYSLHTFLAGEKQKNLSSVERIANEMVEAGHDRKSNIVALGGGVVGDMAGFIASIYYRGIPFIQIPTTLMAQIDSSVGGKTAVDIDAGKNLIGAFHQPRLVIVDPDTLRSLSARVLREGMSEMVKHAAIRQRHMLPALAAMGREIDSGLSEQTLASLPELLAENISIKARIVEQDEHETLGIRAFLNLGHTIGHGIEASVPYGDILHGEVVSLGLRAAIYLSIKHCQLPQQDAQDILSCLKDIGLPLELPAEVDPTVALARTASDKKFEAGAIRFVLLSALEQPLIYNELSREDLADAIAELSRPLD